MLKREMAQASLAEVAIKEWSGPERAAIAALPKKLAELGNILRLQGANDYKKYNEATRSVGDLTVDERSQLFTAIFPQIGQYVFQAYESLLLSLPFQSGTSRRAFRSQQVHHHQRRRDQCLTSWLQVTQAYHQPLDWYAAWAPYLRYGANQLGLVFAAAMNTGDAVGNQVFDILCDSARGEHEIGAMGRHVVRSLLIANRPEGWQLMENMLVAAQRQEGLRQSILETVDESHPEAFTRMLRVIVEQNMVRFSATVRAADVWFGLGWDVTHKRHVQASLEQLLALREHPDQQEAALQGEDPEQVYVALWVLAFEDVERAIAAAKPLLQDQRVEMRFVAAYLLRQIGVGEVIEAIAPSLADEDLRIAAQAFRATQHLSAGPLAATWFESLEAFLQRFEKKETKLEPLVWPWMSETISLGSYTLHLGSATVHRQLGGALCIVPVHSQHRGRLFLPFADDDPKTAEVISKALLLAKDSTIKDPTILEQLL